MPTTYGQPLQIENKLIVNQPSYRPNGRMKKEYFNITTGEPPVKQSS